MLLKDTLRSMCTCTEYITLFHFTFVIFCLILLSCIINKFEGQLEEVHVVIETQSRCYRKKARKTYIAWFISYNFIKPCMNTPNKLNKPHSIPVHISVTIPYFTINTKCSKQTTIMTYLATTFTGTTESMRPTSREPIAFFGLASSSLI